MISPSPPLCGACQARAWGPWPRFWQGVEAVNETVTVPKDHPLSQEHLECLNRVLARCPAAIECARAAVECGWPFEDFLRELEQMQRQAREAKLRFFPHSP